MDLIISPKGGGDPCKSLDKLIRTPFFCDGLTFSPFTIAVQALKFPGSTRDTFTPNLAISTRRQSEKVSMPCLVTPYADIQG